MANESELRLTDFRERLAKLRRYLDVEKRQEEIARLDQTMTAPGFWDNREAAQATIEEVNEHKRWVDTWQGLEDQRDDLMLLNELAVEEDDGEAMAEVTAEANALEKKIAELEFRNMLSGRDDAKNALLTIHPGAGGTESADWAQMLLRMYMRWIERKGFRKELMDLQPGDEAGIKSATVEVTGKYAYGYLKAEAGVHRLVRLSPFDSQNRRHTSFASVFVYPEIEDAVEVEINESDLRVDTYRASGAGGQHVNKTDSAVRITHLPTGIVVQCQNERSQHRNKDIAMKMLKAQLYDREKKIQQEEQQELHGDKKEIAWGSQIRSYVLQPYRLAKDHRTNYETQDIDAVLDGDLEKFMEEYLRHIARNS
ncbi:MAG: peptide chain release factor 2 [Candidatus Latescibacteria bacterium]|nr:peptide chain release factor 2 [Candidatus Latescibacterota bacterium]